MKLGLFLNWMCGPIGQNPWAVVDPSFSTNPPPPARSAFCATAVIPQSSHFVPGESTHVAYKRGASHIDIAHVLTLLMQTHCDQLVALSLPWMSGLPFSMSSALCSTLSGTQCHPLGLGLVPTMVDT
jgi:hypothetical protein